MIVDFRRSKIRESSLKAAAALDGYFALATLISFCGEKKLENLFKMVGGSPRKVGKVR